MSSIKGLVLALDKQVIAISSLDALAYQLAFTNYQACNLLIYALIDARKNSLYFNYYKFINNNLVKQEKETVIFPKDLVDFIKQKENQKALLIGNGAILYKNFFEDNLHDLVAFAPQNLNIIKASIIGLLANNQNSKNNLNLIDSVFEITPSYVRQEF